MPSILYPSSFFSPDNLRVILNNLAVDGILAVGMMTLMIGGVFDLSVGSMMSMVGVVVRLADGRQGWPVAAAVPPALVRGGAGRPGERAARGARAGQRPDRDAGDARRLPGRGHPDRRPGRGQPAARVHGDGADRVPGRPVAGLAHARAGRARALPASAHAALAGSSTTSGATHGRRGSRGSGSSDCSSLGFIMMGFIAGLAGLAFAARVGTAVSAAGIGAELRVITAVILGGASLTGRQGAASSAAWWA